MASSDFNQAYQRMKFLQQYAEFRKRQAHLIVNTQADLNFNLEKLRKQRLDKMKLIRSKEEELGKLQEEKSQKHKTVEELSLQEKELKTKLKSRQKEAEKLSKAIEQIIAEQIKLSESKEGSRENRAISFKMTPEEFQLTQEFSSSKGKISWPVEKGLVSSTFGEHQHPVLKKVIVKNNGIDILVEEGSTALAVFEGKVVSITDISNTNTAILIRHGEYFSVYSNLMEVYVRTGDKVKAGQRLGQIYTNDKEAKTELHFEIWKGKTLMNPLFWIKPKK